VSAAAQAPEDAIVRRLLWRLMPLITLVYLTSVIDKANIGFAKLQMIRDLEVSEQAFGFGASLFFVAMLVCEIPSSLMAFRFGLRGWAARIMLTWAACTLLLAATNGPLMLCILRFLLGVAEAGLYPAIVFYISQWFPDRHRAAATGMLTLGSALGNGAAALASGPLLDLDGVLGLAGWQWLFVATGVLPLVAAGVIWRWLPSRIGDARFLTADEKACLQDAVQRDHRAGAPPKLIVSVLWQPAVLFYSAMFIVILTALYGVIYWTPTVVKAFAPSGAAIGVLSAGPWAVVAVMLVTLPRRLKSPAAIAGAMAAFGLGGAALFALGMSVEQPALRYLGLVLGTPCISLLITCFWTWPSRRYSGVEAAAAFAAISTYGNLGGFLAQNLMPWAARTAGSAAGALAVPAISLAIVGAGALIAWLSMRSGRIAPALERRPG
jgi:MFS family permease